MIQRIPQRSSMLLTLALAVTAAAIGCGGGGPEFTQEMAANMISAQWPDADVQMRNAYIDEQGRGVAAANFDGEPWEFYFAAGPEGTWTLDAVSVDGGFFRLSDLEQISATMMQMGEAASALEAYKGANGTYPEGDSPEVLLVLIPDYLAEETERQDAWGQGFLYESDGDDYTLTSIGADGQPGTKDDINLYNGAFVGASQGGGQGQ
ncbi:MAG: type II secretion system protein GspG [Acidobacteriota bacterium]|jgi:hypothetical protein